MSLKEWLQLIRDTAIRPSDSTLLGRVLARLDEVLAAIEALQVAEKLTPAQALVRIEWRAALFPYELFPPLLQQAPAAVHDRLRRVEKDLRAQLAAVGQAARDGEAAQVLGARDGLVQLRAQLESLVPELQRGSPSARLLQTGLALSGLLGALSVAYLRSDLGLQLLRVEALAPAAAYSTLQQDGAELVPQPDYLADFMAEFSKAYFGHPSQFEALYYDRSREGKPSQRRTLQHKLSLRNASHGQVRYLSSVEAVVEVGGEARFPWELLTVTPRISIKSSEQPPVVVSDGIGPALDLSWQWRSGRGLVLSQGRQAVLHRAEQPAYLRPEIGEREVKDEALLAPLYLQLSAPPTTADAARYLQVGPQSGRGQPTRDCGPPPPSQYGWYEILRSPATVQAVTAIAYAEPWTLQTRYRALNQAQETVKEEPGKLSRERLYFQRTARLFERDPRCGEGRDSDNLIDHLDGPPLASLAMMFAEEKAIVQPKGVDLLTARLGLDLWQLASGRRLASSAELDGFLNPQGVLAVYLSLNMPERRRYRIALRVNGQPVASYHFAGLVPEFLDFHSEGETQAVARLRRIFGVPQP